MLLLPALAHSSIIPINPKKTECKTEECANPCSKENSTKEIIA